MAKLHLAFGVPTSASFQRAFRDPSLYFLVFSNVSIIGFVAFGKMDIVSVFIIYWIQSIVIGLLNIIKILSLKEFTTEGFTSNGKPVLPTRKSLVSTAKGFTIHYGLFLFAYGGIVISQNQQAELYWPGIIGASLLFLINHSLSLYVNFEEQVTGKNLGLIMFAPYVRLLPMTIFIAAASNIFALIPFIFAKTLLDALTHIFKHAKETRRVFDL